MCVNNLLRFGSYEPNREFEPSLSSNPFVYCEITRIISSVHRVFFKNKLKITMQIINYYKLSRNLKLLSAIYSSNEYNYLIIIVNTYLKQLFNLYYLIFQKYYANLLFQSH